MYQTVTIIGLGSLGGFLCKYLCESSLIHNMIIIDNDIVENKNVYNSIYKPIYIGEFKVDAIQHMLKYTDIPIIKINTKYEEGITVIPESDLVIDCRDVVIDRGNEINLRLYINGYDLVFDCRRSVHSVYNYEGFYSINLPKEKIKHAAYIALEVIKNNSIKNMIDNNLIKKISLNLINETLKESIKKSQKDREDIIYESTDNGRRILCFEEILKPTLILNKKQDIKVCVKNSILKEKPLEIPILEEKMYVLAEVNQILSYEDLIKKMENIVSLQPTKENYIATIEKGDDGYEYIELFLESGAA